MNLTFLGEDFAARQQSNLDAFLCLANSTLDGIDRLDTLNRHAVQAAFDTGASRARALCDQEGVKQALTAQSPESVAESTKAYFRSIYEISSQMQKEFLELFEVRMTEVNDALSALLAKSRQGNSAAVAAAATGKAVSVSAPATARARKAA